MLFLALVTHLNPHSVILLAPLVLLLAKNAVSSRPQHISVSVGIFTMAFIALLLSSFICNQYSWDFMPATFGFIFSYPEYTPNVGLWWYLFIEMFDAFRSFFVFVFHVHVFIYAIPISIRFKERPIYAIIILLIILAHFTPFVSMPDIGLYLALLPMLPEVAQHRRTSFIWASLLAFATVLAPTFYHLWLHL